MDVAHAELESHMGYCGTRTEPCVKCQQFVMVKDLEKHMESNCTYPPKPANENSATRTLSNGNPASRNMANGSGFVEPDELLFGGRELNMFAFEEMKRILNATEVPEVTRGTVSDGVREVPRRENRAPLADVSSRSTEKKRRANQKSDLNRLRGEIEIFKVIL